MPTEALVPSAFALSLVVALAATPVAIRLAHRAGFHDHPLGYKGHAHPTPYLGGAAVFTGFLVGALLAGSAGSRLAAIPACAVGLWVVGTLDDRFGLAASPRLLAEAAAAGVIVAAGLGWTITGDAGLDLAISVLWLVALSNAFNLMDNMDGAACTVALFSSLGTAVLALVLGDITLGALSLALCGACLGFLRYNLAGPARIFLGDGGSMPIGFVVGATLMALPLHHNSGWHRLAVAVLVAGLPLLDTALVILSRRRAGVPIMQGGRDHLTHRLRRRLPSARAVALALGGAQALLCAAALWLTRLSASATVVAWVLLLFAGAVAVAIMETRTWAPERLRADTPTEPLQVATRASPPPRRTGMRRPDWVEVVLVLIVAASCGLSPFFYGFYNLDVWGPIALGLLAILLGLVIARPAVPRPTAIVALAGLAALAGWTLVSSAWAGSPGNASAEANRWILYATLLAMLLLLLRDDRLGRLLLAATTTLVLALAGYVVVRMLAGESGVLFFAKRLNTPLGYVNGQASYFLFGLWPLIAVAERVRRPWLAGAAAAGAAMLGSLVLLSETRAIVPAIVISAALLLALVPGRLRRAWVLVVVSGAVAVAGPTLLHVYNEPGIGVTAATARSAAGALIAASIGAGIVWGLATFALTRLGSTGARTSRATTAASAGALLAIVAVALIGTVHHPGRTISRELHSFTQLRSTKQDRNRFLSGGGTRYDYWRIALNEFRTEPLRGVGAGSYQFGYFKQRRSEEDVRQPHSLELQVLAELGIVGAVFLALFLGAVLVGLGHRAARARRSPTDVGLVVAAGGVFLVWVVHTSVDWIHRIPGLTGVALAAAAVLVAPWQRTASGTRGALHKVVIVGCSALVVGAAILIGRAALADRHARSASGALPANPTRALRETARSLNLNGDLVATYYTRAAAFARLNDYFSARATLLKARRLEPQNFVIWALLGDLATRHGDLRVAHADYLEAHRLNPRDVELKALARR